MHSIGIWGTGVVGLSVARYLRAQYPHIALHIYDDRPMPPATRNTLEALGAQMYCGTQMRDAYFAATSTIVPSPGVPPHKIPPTHTLVTELDLFTATWQLPYVAITGTVGKTTITTFIGKLLASHHRVAVGGNIGIALLDFAHQQDAYTYGVFELSDAQLERARPLAPAVAVITNISDNHLDRHGTREAYIAAKCRIFMAQQPHQTAILPLMLMSHIRAHCADHRGQRIWCAPSAHEAACALLGPEERICWIDDAHIWMRDAQGVLQCTGTVPAGMLTYPDNILICTVILATLGLTPAWDTLTTHDRPLHRLTSLGTTRGITFLNDSKSTVPAATVAALQACRGTAPIVLFLGGVSKGVDRLPFVRTIASIPRLIVCFGAEANQLAAAVIESGGAAISTSTLEDAFAQYVDTRAQSGDLVLFSPSGASYDLFRDYEARGDRFMELVAQFRARSS